jgi:lipopolysaccharide export LptBFGC system permease protein LptF
VVAAASAALGCRDWRLALPVAVLLALFLAAVFGVGG